MAAAAATFLELALGDDATAPGTAPQQYCAQQPMRVASRSNSLCTAPTTLCSRSRAAVQPMDLSEDGSVAVTLGDVSLEVPINRSNDDSDSFIMKRASKLFGLYFTNIVSSDKAKYGAIFVGLSLSLITQVINTSHGFNTFTLLFLSTNCHRMISKERSYVTLFAIVMMTIIVDIYNTFFGTKNSDGAFAALTLITFTIITTKLFLLYDLFFNSTFIEKSESNDSSNGVKNNTVLRDARTFLVRRVRLFLPCNFKSSNYTRYVRGRMIAIGILTLVLLFLYGILICAAIVQFRIADDAIFFRPARGVRITTFLIVKALFEMVLFAMIARDTNVTMALFHFGVLGRKNSIVKRLLDNYNRKGAAIPFFFAFDYSRFELISALKVISCVWGMVGQVTLYTSVAISVDPQVRLFEGGCIFTLLISDYYVPALFTATAIMYKTYLTNSYKNKVRNVFYDSDDSELDEEKPSESGSQDGNGDDDKVANISTTANVLNESNMRGASMLTDGDGSGSDSGAFESLWEVLEISQSFSCDVSLAGGYANNGNGSSSRGFIRMALVNHFSGCGFIVENDTPDDDSAVIYINKVLFTIRISSWSQDFAAVITLNKNNKVTHAAAGDTYVYTLFCTSRSSDMSVLKRHVATFDLNSIFVLKQIM